MAGEEFDDYVWIEWPQHGEYANTTNFLTQKNACEVLFFETGRAIEEIALFTDGIERLVLDVAARSVHSPAFKPIFEWLARNSPGRDGTTFGSPDGLSRARIMSAGGPMTTRRW